MSTKDTTAQPGKIYDEATHQWVDAPAPAAPLPPAEE